MRKLFFLLSTTFFLLLASPIHAAAQNCPPGESRYRPGGACEKETPAIQNLNNYPLTCQDVPVVTYEATSDFPGRIGSTFPVQISADITNSEIGGLGPSASVISSYSPDSLAQVYPFNALFDKPTSMKDESREAGRTYWRLLSSFQQANVKSIYLNRVNDSDRINNQSLEYTDPATTNLEHTTVLDLFLALPSCLTRVPVCNTYLKSYLALPLLTQAAYDALLPFNFDNLRGYQVLNRVIYKENLAFVNAIADGLNDPQTGLLNNLSPQWMNDERQLQPLLTTADLSDTFKQNEENTPAHTNAILSLAANLDPLNCYDHKNVTYLPSSATFPQSLGGSLTQKVDIIITDSIREIDGQTGKITYKILGHSLVDPQPVAVVNNPKLADLNNSLKGKNSLYSIFTPNSSVSSDRDLGAPLADFSSDNAGITVNARSKYAGLTDNQSRIGRTSGDATTKLCELRNQWLIPAGLQKSYIDCVNPYQTLLQSAQGPALGAPTKIPTQVNCDPNAPAGNPGSLLPPDKLVATNYPSGAGKANITRCYNDLVSRSNQAGYDPAFVMAIWLEESAASWYSTYPGAADFGCVVNTNRMDFNDQISCFLALKSAYAGRPRCLAGTRQTYEDFLLVFSEGFAACKNTDGSLPSGTCTDSDGHNISNYRNFCGNPLFPDRIKEYYRLVTGGKQLNFASPL